MELTKLQRSLALQLSTDGGLSIDFTNNAIAMAPASCLALSALGREAGFSLDFTDNSSAVTIPGVRVQAIFIT